MTRKESTIAALRTIVERQQSELHHAEDYIATCEWQLAQLQTRQHGLECATDVYLKNAATYNEISA